MTFNSKNHKKKNTEYFRTRDCFPKFANGLNIKIGIAQKVYEL